MAKKGSLRGTHGYRGLGVLASARGRVQVLRCFWAMDLVQNRDFRLFWPKVGLGGDEVRSTR